MQEIGKKLQTKRRELKLSYDDVAKMTRMPVNNIKAIENGDFDYFKNDITYLRFYVQAYCKALNVPYQEIKDDFTETYNEYTNTMSLEVLQKHEKIETNIKEKVKSNKSVPQEAAKDRKSIRDNVANSRRFTPKKLDLSLISLIVVIILVVALLIFGGIKLYGGSSASKTTTKTSEKTTNETPTPEKTTETTKDKTKTTTKTTKLTVSKTDANTYVVSGINSGDSYTFNMAFTADTWQQTTLNNASITEMTGTFGTKSPIKYQTKSSGDDIYVIQSGHFNASSITINDTKLTFDASIADQSVVTVTIEVKGK